MTTFKNKTSEEVLDLLKGVLREGDEQNADIDIKIESNDKKWSGIITIEKYIKIGDMGEWITYTCKNCGEEEKAQERSARAAKRLCMSCYIDVT